ncbi:hypothetical protein K457DRAFT_22021 [Linnemannia elongata AG-77]|uniref:Uncharacterized protein n=1 Tax=Linnemannia elongata AG-77 TaxID=1314771 RepID=A0A197JNB6_9FUNG|nr:hypothetical protein K457DRAFT_22021 [Linnemannia elongata AG-77]
MVYKGKNFDPNYHLKKKVDKSLPESNYSTNNSNNKNTYYHNNSNNYSHNYDTYNHNDSYTSPPPPARWTDRSPPDPASSIDGNRSRSKRATSRPRLEDSVDRRPERSSSRNYDDAPPPRRHDNNSINSNNNNNTNSNNTNNSRSSSCSSSSANAKKRETPLEKQLRVADHLARNPLDKRAHANAYKISGADVHKVPEDHEQSGAPALAPENNYMDDTNKDEAEPQQQEQQQQQWSSLSAQAAIPHQDLHQDRNTMESNQCYQNMVRQSSVATTSSVTTTVTPTDNKNPWTRSPSVLSSSSQLLSPASSTMDIHPEPSPNSTLTQPYNWTDQDEARTGKTTESLPSEVVQPCQQLDVTQTSQSQTYPQLDNVMKMVPSLALQAIDEKINFLDHLWRSGNDKLSQTVKVAEQSVLTCVLRQVMEEVRIYAVLRETLHSQAFKGQILPIETLTETMRQLDARRNFDISCLQPGVPIPDIPLDQSFQAMHDMTPLLATSNGVESTTTPAPEVAAPPPPANNVEESAAVSSDQAHLANSSNPRKRTLEQIDSDQTQGSRATMYHDIDSSVTEDTKGPDLQPSNNSTVHQSSVDTTATTLTTITTLPTLDRPHTPSSAEVQRVSTTSSTSSLSLDSLSSSISSTPTTRTSKRDKPMPNKAAGTPPLGNSYTDPPALQESNSVPPALTDSIPASKDMEQTISTNSGRTSYSGRTMMDIEKELRLIREEGQEQRLRTDQLLAQLESEARLRREADHRVSQLTRELQSERHLTLEKDLESKRSEALLMMAKAREEIQQGKVLIAQVKEELALERAAKAEAMIETARIEVERNRLLAYVQSLGGPSAVMPGGPFMGCNPAMPPTSAATLLTRFPSPTGSDGGGQGVLVTAAESPSGQVNQDRLIDAAAISVKVEGSL